MSEEVRSLLLPSMLDNASKEDLISALLLWVPPSRRRHMNLSSSQDRQALLTQVTRRQISVHWERAWELQSTLWVFPLEASGGDIEDREAVVDHFVGYLIAHNKVQPMSVSHSTTNIKEDRVRRDSSVSMSVEEIELPKAALSDPVVTQNKDQEVDPPPVPARQRAPPEQVVPPPWGPYSTGLGKPAAHPEVVVLDDSDDDSETRIDVPEDVPTNALARLRDALDASGYVGKEASPIRHKEDEEPLTDDESSYDCFAADVAAFGEDERERANIPVFCLLKKLSLRQDVVTLVVSAAAEDMVNHFRIGEYGLEVNFYLSVAYDDDGTARFRRLAYIDSQGKARVFDPRSRVVLSPLQPSVNVHSRKVIPSNVTMEIRFRMDDGAIPGALKRETQHNVRAGEHEHGQAIPAAARADSRSLSLPVPVRGRSILSSTRSTSSRSTLSSVSRTSGDSKSAQDKAVLRWLATTEDSRFTKDESYQQLNDDKQKHIPQSVLRLVRWAKFVHSLLLIGRTPPTAPMPGHGRRITRAIIGSFVNRGEDWVRQAINVARMISEHPEHPEVQSPLQQLHAHGTLLGMANLEILLETAVGVQKTKPIVVDSDLEDGDESEEDTNADRLLSALSTAEGRDTASGDSALTHEEARLFLIHPISDKDGAVEDQGAAEEVEYEWSGFSSEED
ncbi:hypothetical protein C8Q80DRAFT_1272993 [Daedaleopsis nitida]|nr:hypothetical protein C8Q80DRAFT_1272993 [Daedaleopsis nitida]